MVLGVQVEPPVHDDSLVFVKCAAVGSGKVFQLCVHAAFQAVCGGLQLGCGAVWWVEPDEEVALLVEALEPAVGSAGSGMGVPPLLVVADAFWDLLWGDLVAVGALFEPVTVEVMGPDPR